MINGNLKQRALRTLNLENEKKPINTNLKLKSGNNIEYKITQTKPLSQKKQYQQAKLHSSENHSKAKDVSEFNFDLEEDISNDINNENDNKKQTSIGNQSNNLKFMHFQSMIKGINLD